MARDRDERGTRYRDGGEYLDHDHDRDRRHRRRHRAREYDDDEPSAATRERRERRRADDARREAELDIDDLRARRESYYARPEAERRRDSERMAQEIRREPVRDKPRSGHREIRRDGTRRAKRREVVADDRSDDYVYGRPKSRPHAEEATVRRSSARKRSDEGGSSNRTAYTPLSGSGSASVRRVEIPTLTRSSSAREPARTYGSTRPSVRRTSTIKSPTPLTPLTRTQSIRDTTRKTTGGLLSSFFRPPIQRTSSAVVHKEVQRVDCLVCMNDELPINKTVKLACGHRMCYSCLKRQFTLSVQDPQHMPPRCCTTEHIPLKYAERLFDDKFKVLWNRKYQEYTTANRLYCPAKGCGQWIKPSRIKMDPTYGRKYARFHTKRECPKDEETNRLVEMAKEKGWQRCYSCKAVVELKEGCNHMTCRCTAQFCMVCAAPWKTCNCPWFNYQHIPDDDRLNDMRVPYTQRYPDIEVIEIPHEPSPPLARRSSTRTRNRSERDRDLDRADQVLTAHLRDQLHLNSTPTVSEVHRVDPGVQIYGLGNAGSHHMNESYAIRSMPTSAQRTAARQAAPRGSFFTSTRRVPAPVTMRSAPPPVVTSSTMAGLSKDGRKVGANRVGTWLSHVQIDPEATNTAAKDVEVDDWRCDGTMIGID
ncbi:IBR domain-containing protein [Decorospora gaudefroyi]|uniref:IBR domain-containing protein n=1 Tax=Decorospora gaudefroyi TaxID=184978 RepID=A0A6A5JZ98_9PLEO|nr:IBR domain-containing protein [Decorospora gaudefroyi]